MKKKLFKELNKLLPDNWEVGKYTLSGGDEFGDNIFNLKIYGKKHPTTTAEIEAHKLRFYIGDEVWIKNVTYSKKFIIKEFRKFHDGIYVITECGQNLWLSALTKTPSKKPILKLQDKFLYEGDEYWWVDNHNNWNLFKEKCESDESNISATFLTKQDALNYVLSEAKERFEGKNFTHKNACKIIRAFNVFLSNSCDSIHADCYCIWNAHNGWIAEPIKEPKLMLGKYKVKINTVTLGKCMDDGVDVVIKCNGGQVTKQQWLEWFYLFMSTRNVFVYCQFYLSRYLTEYRKKPFELKIGYIENITMEQIQAITDRLNEV